MPLVPRAVPVPSVVVGWVLWVQSLMEAAVAVGEAMAPILPAQSAPPLEAVALDVPHLHEYW